MELLREFYCENKDGVGVYMITLNKCRMMKDCRACEICKKYKGERYDRN